MKSFWRNGFEFPVIDDGADSNGPPVVLLHGFPAESRTWDPVREGLVSAGHRVLVPEQRGYASSARPGRRRDYRLGELTADVVALIDASGSPRAHVVGHDWGGLVAWALADIAPDRLVSVTSVSTPHPRTLRSVSIASRQLYRSWYMLLFQLPLFPELLTSSHDGLALRRLLERSGLQPDLAERYATKLASDPGRPTGALNWYRALPFDLDVLRSAEKVKVPSQLIVGTADVFVDLRAARATSEWVEGPFESAELQDGTHWLIEQTPDKVTALIADFVATHSK